MPIEFRCSQCEQLLRVPDDSAGKNARCPKCQALNDRAGEHNRRSSARADHRVFAVCQFARAKPRQAAAWQPLRRRRRLCPATRQPLCHVNSQPQPQSVCLAVCVRVSPPVPSGPRPGLPWEQGRSVGSWFQTMTLVLGSPSQAFAQMHQAGGLGGPILYAFWSLAIPVLLLCLLISPFILLAVNANNNNNNAANVGMVVGMAIGMLIAVILYVLLIVTVGALIYAAIIHVGLLLVGGAKQGFETTFRVVSFTQGSVTPIGMLLNCIPYLGYLIHMVWFTAVTIIGISKAHEIPGGKAAAGVLIPFGICIGVGISLVVFAAIMDANR